MSPADLERVRAYIDGELDAAAGAALVRDAEADAALGRELDAQRALRAMLRSLPPIVVPEPRARSAWARLWEARRLSLRPAVAFAAAVAFALMGAVADRALVGGAPAGAGAPPSVAMVPVRFVFVGHAQQVAVAGTFNHWSAKTDPLTASADGVWETTVLVPKGEQRYQFQVDGQWMPDPLAERQAPDGMGHVDSVIEL